MDKQFTSHQKLQSLSKLPRQYMIEKHLKGRGLKDARVLNAFLKTPREDFISEDFKTPELLTEAYADYPLRIGYGQTISQPYIVAYMLEAAELKPKDRVLEIGTGSGYQTALLARLVKEVYSIERIPELMVNAEKNLKSFNFKNIHLKIGDGCLGWKQHAPFDAIIVTAAARKIPQAYFDQLAEGGRLIVPEGEFSQVLVKIKKTKGQFERTELTDVRFVPLISDSAPLVEDVI
jgi:protein-L-isoaspartate(D-aspartate) O-methyltransferase